MGRREGRGKGGEEAERKGTGGPAPFRKFLDPAFLQFFSNRANRQMLISVTCSDLLFTFTFRPYMCLVFFYWTLQLFYVCRGLVKL